MATSFSVTKRYFDDKNYPRGFSRQGDFTIHESQLLEQFGQACLALEKGERSPTTKEEKHFVDVFNGKNEVETPLEKVWLKYRSKINATKHIFILSGDTSQADDLDASDDD